MGRDCKMMLRDNVQLLSEFAKIIESEIVKEEGSLLINQILEAHLSKKYEEVYDALAKMLEELKK
jgi:ATP/maltotriose-dependent transcriptional regulator MalT